MTVVLIIIILLLDVSVCYCVHVIMIPSIHFSITLVSPWCPIMYCCCVPVQWCMCCAAHWCLWERKPRGRYGGWRAVVSSVVSAAASVIEVTTSSCKNRVRRHRCRSVNVHV